jgi:hypothetical protein
MSSIILNGVTAPWLYLNGTNITEAYLNGTKVFSAPPAIGSTFGGGIVAGYILENSIPYVLIVYPDANGSYGHNSGLAPHSSAVAVAGTESMFDGHANTQKLNGSIKSYVNTVNGSSSYNKGYTDWYLPAVLELEIAYRNLKPSTAANHTAWGANANALPFATGVYTTSSPAQRAITNPFVVGGYWASTQYSGSTTANWLVFFDDGEGGIQAKNYAGYYFRLMRKQSLA